MNTIGTLTAATVPNSIYDPAGGNAILADLVGVISGSGQVITQLDMVCDSGGGSGIFSWSLFKDNGTQGPPLTLLAQGVSTIIGASAHTHTIPSLNIAINNADRIWASFQSIDSSNRFNLYSTVNANSDPSGFPQYVDYTTAYPNFNNPFVNGDHQLASIIGVLITYGPPALALPPVSLFRPFRSIIVQ